MLALDHSRGHFLGPSPSLDGDLRNKIVPPVKSCEQSLAFVKFKGSFKAHPLLSGRSVQILRRISAPARMAVRSGRAISSPGPT